MPILFEKNKIDMNELIVELRSRYSLSVLVLLKKKRI